jgi:uroporphyrinogen-III synthase
MAKILISQPRPQTEKSPYFDVAEKYNLDLVFRPFIKIEPMTPKEFRAQKIPVAGHTAVVFTSRHAIDHFFNLCKEMRVNIPTDMKYFSVSEQVSLYVQKYVQYRKRKNFFSETGKLADLMPFIQKHNKDKYFAPLSSVHNDDVFNLLEEAGVEHDEAAMYYTVTNDFQPGEKLDYDMLIFFSPEGIHSLVKNFPDFEQGKVCIACLGSKTVQEAKKAGLRVDLTTTPDLRSVPAMIEEFAKSL